MEIQVAGAGAGKTTTMAQKVIELREQCNESKIIFCITFTNNAVECINKKLLEHYKTIPQNIVISTIHSFLYNELIKPYYCLLYKKHYKKISVIDLPNDVKAKKYKLSKLENADQLHQTSIPERAKWVIYKKSNDTANIKRNRTIINNTLKEYIGAICIDEAQDVDKDMKVIIEAFDSLDIPLYLMGDPKQDLRGYGCFREIVNNNNESTHYSNNCYRCPQKHLILSNQLISKSEQQISQKSIGELLVCYESETNCKDLINMYNYDLVYISKKQGAFETHNSTSNVQINESVADEIITAMKHNHPKTSDILIQKASYYYAQILLEKYQECNDKKRAMRDTFKLENLGSNYYASIISSIPDKIERKNDCILLNSIESIKGEEGHNCLFILTSDLASYLFGKKTEENKTKNKLYVALTRSLENLTIFITSDVENKYGKEKIISFFKMFT